MSENSDALVVVVSEETGTISLARAGRLERDFDKESLKKVLLAYLTSQTETVEQGGGENG